MMSPTCLTSKAENYLSSIYLHTEKHFMNAFILTFFFTLYFLFQICKWNLHNWTQICSHINKWKIADFPEIFLRSYFSPTMTRDAISYSDQLNMIIYSESSQYFSSSKYQDDWRDRSNFQDIHLKNLPCASCFRHIHRVPGLQASATTISSTVFSSAQ